MVELPQSMRSIPRDIDSNHRTELNTGRLSAESVQQQYELAAQNVENMGAEIRDRLLRLRDALAECDQDMRLLSEAASAIREKGRYVAVQIEETAALSKTIRNMCSEFKLKFNGG